MWKSLHTGLLAAAGLVACGLIVLASPADPAVASGQVCVGVVIDDGNGVTPAPQAAQVQPGASDLDILNAANDSVTQNSSGLVCGIDGVPANSVQNCLATANGLYYFWSYWLGNPSTNTWTYAQIGPAEHTVAAGQSYVEGWRFQNPGPDNASAAKPSVSPAAAFAAACPSQGFAPAAGAGGGGTAGGGTAPGGSALGGSASGGSDAGASAGTGGSVTPADPTTSGPGSAPGGAAPTSGAASPAPGTSGTTAAPGASTTKTGGTAGPSRDHRGRATTTTGKPRGGMQSKSKTTLPGLALAGAGAHRGAGGGGNPALPIIVVAVIVGLLGAGAWLRWRRRPAEQ